MRTACLLIANDVEPGFEADFEGWYQRQHVDERLGVPGFLTARRYRAVSASHAFVAFYELAAADVLASPAYLARLDAPTDWTRRVMPGFRRMNRTVMSRETSIGRGMGALMDLVVVDHEALREPFPDVANLPWFDHVAFERARLLRASPSAVSVAGSKEAALRPGGDASFGMVWLVEWADLVEHEVPDARRLLVQAGLPVVPDAGGRYRLINARSSDARA